MIGVVWRDAVRGGILYVMFAERKSVENSLGDSVMEKLITLISIVIIALLLIVLSGCTSRLDAGRMIGLDLGISVGEGATAVTTALDKSAPGANISAHKPTVEATAQYNVRGFKGLEVNHE